MRRLTRKPFIRFLLLTIIMIGFVIVSVVISASRSNQAMNRGWQPAYQVAPSALLAQVVKDHIQPGLKVDSNQMKAWKIQQPEQAQPLYLLDTRVSATQNPLCGTAGCLFTAYIATTKHHFQPVFSHYLNPLLPKNMPLIQPTATLWGGLPCLIINQLEAPKVRTYKLCFTGQTYETLETQLLPQTYE
jgi:hypothetical protein